MNGGALGADRWVEEWGGGGDGTDMRGYTRLI